jgi:hypothetical protein
VKPLWETSFNSRKSTLVPLSFDLDWTSTKLVFQNDWPPEVYQAAAAAAANDQSVSPAQALVAASQATTSLAQATLQAFNSAGSQISIPPNVNTQSALLNASTKRNMLLIQNNSTLNDGAGNVGPTLLMALDGPVGVGAYQLNFPPGFGLLLDQKVFSNPIFVGWTGGTGTFVQGAVCMVGYTQKG